MADYTTTAVFKDAVKITASDRDDEIGRCITAASRLFDRLTRRDDNAFVSTSGTKYLTPARADRLWVPDLLSITTLKTDDNADGTYETTWAATDYFLWPYDGPPYKRVEVAVSTGDYSFPVAQRSVEIVGAWGRTATVPDDVARAVILLAHRLYNRPKTPEGVVGSPERGFVHIADLDPDVATIVTRYMNEGALFA